MAFEYLNAISELKDIFSNDWNSTNTDNVTPNFEYVYNKKRLDSFWNGDWVLFQKLTTATEHKYIGNNSRTREYNIRIDIRSTYYSNSVSGIEHLYKMEKEANRIISENKVYNFTTGKGLIDIISNTDLSDGLKNLWRVILDVRAKILIENVT